MHIEQPPRHLAQYNRRTQVNPYPRRGLAIRGEQYCSPSYSGARSNPEGNKTLWIVGGVLGVAALGAALYFILRDPPQSKDKNKGGGGGTGSGLPDPGTGTTDPGTGSTGTPGTGDDSAIVGTSTPAKGERPPQSRSGPVGVEPRKAPPLSDWAKKDAMIGAAEAAWSAEVAGINVRALPDPPGWEGPGTYVNAKGGTGYYCDSGTDNEKLLCVNRRKAEGWLAIKNEDPPLSVYASLHPFDAEKVAAGYWLKLYGDTGLLGDPMAPCNIVLTQATAKPDAPSTKMRFYQNDVSTPTLPWPMMDLAQRIELASRIKEGMPND